MKLSAIIPTLDSRTSLLEQTIDSLAQTADVEVELIVVRNSATIGEAWNQGANEATGTHLWLGADDVTFLPGWLDAASEAVEADIYPCPRILRPDGSVEACGTLGQGGLFATEMQDGVLCGASQFPFMAMEAWESIGPCIAIGYYADDYLGYRARAAGLDVRLVRGYSLTHHVGTAGRGKQVARAMEYRQSFIDAITAENALREAAV